jgi:hypothetical protein
MVVDTMPTPPDLRLIVSQLFPDESEKEQALVKSDHRGQLSGKMMRSKQIATKSDNETCMHLNQGSYTRTMRHALACLHSSVAF